MLEPRQTDTPTSGDVPDGYVIENGRIVPFWYSTTGIVIKWVVFLGLLLAILGFICFARVHARRRIRRGLLPKRYHKWLVTRADLAKVDPSYAVPNPMVAQRMSRLSNYFHGPYYMPPIRPERPAPPPVYDPNAPPPPMYSPPRSPPSSRPASALPTGPTGRDDDGSKGAAGLDDEPDARSGDVEAANASRQDQARGGISGAAG